MDRGIEARDPPRGLDAVDARHADVHQDHVGSELVRQVHCSRPVPGSPTTLTDVGMAAVLFLLGRTVLAVDGPRAPRSVRPLVGARPLAVAAVGAGSLLASANVFKTTDADRLASVLNAVSIYGALFLGRAVVGIGAVTFLPRPRPLAERSRARSGQRGV